MSKVLRFLRDQIWQFVGAVIGLIAVLVAYNIFFLERPVKQMQVMLLSDTSLVDISPEIVNDIEVYYKGDLSKNIALVDFRIENTGNQPITEADYSREITISINPSFEIVDNFVLESDPANIGLFLTRTSNYEVKASPVLLNPGDSVTARLILIDRDDVGQSVDFSVDGRIVGVRQIEVSAIRETGGELRIGPFSISEPALLAVTAIIVSLFASVFKETIELVLARRRFGE